jgi:hypothetical protein
MMGSQFIKLLKTIQHLTLLFDDTFTNTKTITTVVSSAEKEKELKNYLLICSKMCFDIDIKTYTHIGA